MDRQGCAGGQGPTGVPCPTLGGENPYGAQPGAGQCPGREGSGDWERSGAELQWNSRCLGGTGGSLGPGVWAVGSLGGAAGPAGALGGEGRVQGPTDLDLQLHLVVKCPPGGKKIPRKGGDGIPGCLRRGFGRAGSAALPGGGRGCLGAGPGAQPLKMRLAQELGESVLRRK